MEPERAAQQLLLQNALASESCPASTPTEVDGGAAEFKSVGHRKLLLTNSQTVKFRQLYRKIPVYGSLITVEMDARNHLLSINSALGEPTGVDPVAQVSPAAALEAVRAAAGYGPPMIRSTPSRGSPTTSTPEGTWRLVYIAEDVPQRGGGEGDDHHLPQVFDYVVDAHAARAGGRPAAQPDRRARDGCAALSSWRTRRWTAWRSRAGSAARTCRTSRPLPRRSQPQRPYPRLRLPLGGPRPPPAARQLRRPAGPGPLEPGGGERPRQRLRGRRLPAEGAAAAGDRRSGGAAGLQRQLRAPPRVKEWRNAAWYRGRCSTASGWSTATCAPTPWPGTWWRTRSSTASPSRTARLDYLGESGALNESYSDIFGILIANFSQPDVDAMGLADRRGAGQHGLPLRDLSDPPRRGQPGHMRDYQDLRHGTCDQGGVHANSGIHNKAAYNLLTRARNGAPASSIRPRWRSSSTSPSPSSSPAPRASATAAADWSCVARSLFRSDGEGEREAKLKALTKAFEDVGIES